ncbi:ATP-binding cassette domain-containing protein [Phototrophicus methaneseepsis]|uniref:ATP-binding cassette domain-containing protein n=1 Tax=Phototrophicus methaneseepsis TaxID=2710758 RepID=A0A7S8EB56_9CHLR|nr:ATP-binding cassette domain-containing protein [Phototrophicus methaneseepsis]QPC83720.1 ATP-binding cassette domain-containing protein [Phototrophicus methaneseepsis]
MLVLDSISKLYGQNYSFDNVNLDIADGNVVGVVDHEGQAILELVNMLSGQHRPDKGQIRIDGQRLTWNFRPQQHRVGLIYREPRLVESLDIASHIFLGHEHKPEQLIRRLLNIHDPYQIFSEAENLLSQLNFNLPTAQTLVRNLSLEQRQLVSIAQLIVQSPRVIVIDHPGRTLSLPYQEQLFDLIRKWREEQRITILGTSNLDTLFAVCDRIIVLRNGRIVLDSPIEQTNRETVVAALVSDRQYGQVSPLIWALDTYYQAFRQAQLLRHNQELLEQDLARQNSIRQELLDQLSVQVSALDDANVALQVAQRRLLTEREEERKHLARELHDQVIQDLLTWNYQLEALAESFPELNTNLNGMRDSVRDMVEDIRRICSRLRPLTIDSFGLGTALQSYTHNWSERTGIEVDLQVDRRIGRLTEEIELSLFRIVQESLNNTTKHANASRVAVLLNYLNPRMLQLLIEDNGIGLEETFDLGQLSNEGHFGLLGITERVALLGGRITFRNQPQGGLQIQVEVPHQGVEPQKRNLYGLE